MPSLVFCTGFEFGTTTGWTNGNAGVKVVDAVVGTPAVLPVGGFSGTYAMVANVNNQSAAFTLTTDTLGTGKTACVASFRVMFPVDLPTAGIRLCTITDALTGGCMVHYIPAGGPNFIVQALAGGTSLVSPPISTGKWYLVEILLDVSANPHTVRAAVDGGLLGTTVYGSPVTLTPAAAATTIVDFTVGDAWADHIGLSYFDDVLVSTTAADFPLGSHQVVLLKPDTGATATEIGGVANQWAAMTSGGTVASTFVSADILANTSEVPPTTSATGSMTGAVQRANSASGAGSGGHAVDLPMTSYTLATGETVSGLRMVVCGWAGTATADNISFRTYNGTTERTLFAVADPNFDATTTPSWVCKMATLADFDTQTELDAMSIRAGYSTDINPTPGMNAVYVEVAIKLYKIPIAYDATTRYPVTDGTTTATGDVTFSHAGGSPAAVVVVLMAISTLEAFLYPPLNHVLYGGQTMVLTKDVTAYGYTPGLTYMYVGVWTLGVEGVVPGGTQTVTLAGCTAATKWVQVTSLTSPLYAAINAASVAIGPGTNPHIDLVTTGYTLAVGGMIGYSDALTVPTAGTTLQESQDFTGIVSEAIRRTSEDPSGTVTMGFTQANSEQYIAAAVAYEISDRLADVPHAPIARYYD